MPLYGVIIPDIFGDDVIILNLSWRGGKKPQKTQKNLQFSVRKREKTE
jgi:hypothetical protein